MWWTYQYETTTPTPDAETERWTARVKLLELRAKVANMVLAGKLDDDLESIAWYDG